MRRLLVVALVSVAVFYAGAVAFFAVRQQAFLFPAPPGRRAPVEGIVSGPGFRALWMPPPPGAPVVAHFHGNGEDLADLAGMVELLRSLEVGVFALEYPGYGVSRADGPPGEDRIYRAAEEALAYLRDELHAPMIFLQGQSLGSGVAAEMAARGWGSGLVLISAYTSMGDVASHLLPWVPARLVLRHRFDTAAKASRIRIPVLLIHGAEDELIPASMSETLRRAFPNATLRLIERGDHNDLLVAHRRELREALAPFYAH